MFPSHDKLNFSTIYRGRSCLFRPLGSIIIILSNAKRESTTLNKQSSNNTDNKRRDKFNNLNPLIRSYLS